MAHDLNQESSRAGRMKTNQYGQIQISEQEAFEVLYSQRIDTLENVFLDRNILVDQYNNACDINADRISRLEHLPNLDVSVEQFDTNLQDNWFMPESYRTFDMEEHLFSLCKNNVEIDRVSEELKLFAQYDMITLLCYLKYLVDTMRENNIVWGVGRGSSVASYCLYLLGVHKIDSIKFSLDIREFLK
jgi:DNA polymerase III alpha subunit